MTERSSKDCAYCGRQFEWRAKWERSWDEVRYCSKSCRGSRVGTTDIELEQAIVTLLAARAQGATICPSEAARVVAPEAWRELMDRVRYAAFRLTARGQVEITKKGQRVEPAAARGPIRIRRAPLSKRQR